MPTLPVPRPPSVHSEHSFSQGEDSCHVGDALRLCRLRGRPCPEPGEGFRTNDASQYFGHTVNGKLL